jgi:hypothetical protein
MLNIIYILCFYRTDLHSIKPYLPINKFRLITHPLFNRPLNTDDCLIEVTSWAGFTVCLLWYSNTICHLIYTSCYTVGWFSSKNVSGGSTFRSIFFFTCNFEVNLITHLGVGVLKCWTQFWKRTTQESFQQSLVEIGSIVSEKIFF